MNEKTKEELPASEGVKDEDISEIVDIEVLITKEYKTIGGFIRGCRAVLDKVWGEGIGEEQLALIPDSQYNERTVEELLRDGEEVVCNDGEGTDKIGYQLEFPDKIYAFMYYQEGKVSE